MAYKINTSGVTVATTANSQTNAIPVNSGGNSPRHVRVSCDGTAFVKFGNTVSTTLGAAITTTTATSITVTSAAHFPATNNYQILIDSEQMLVTAGAGTTTWTVTRGYNSTTAATHSNGATVTGFTTVMATANDILVVQHPEYFAVLGFDHFSVIENSSTAHVSVVPCEN